MRLLDEQYTATPFYGVRRMTAWLRSQGYAVNREAGGPADAADGYGGHLPETAAEPASGRTHDLPVSVAGGDDRPGQSGVEHGYHLYPPPGGFVYLVAVIDWFSRYVLSWAVSITLDVSFCLEALETALGRGRPEIFNTDQGAQFTSQAFTERLKDRRHPDQHGWPRPSAGQRVCGAAVADCEVRGGVSAGLPHGAGRTPRVSGATLGFTTTSGSIRRWAIEHPRLSTMDEGEVLNGLRAKNSTRPPNLTYSAPKMVWTMGYTSESIMKVVFFRSGLLTTMPGLNLGI